MEILLPYLRDAANRGHISLQECCSQLRADDAAPWRDFLKKDKDWPKSPQGLAYLSYLAPLALPGSSSGSNGGQIGIGLYNTQEGPLAERADARFGKSLPFIFLSSADVTIFAPDSSTHPSAGEDGGEGDAPEWPATPYHLPKNPKPADTFNVLGKVYGIPDLAAYFTSH